MCKICCDIDQSKRLQAIGIDPSTSDMYYTPSPGFCTAVDCLKVGNYKYDHPCSVPVWSLQKLLNMLPEYLVGVNEFGCHFNYLHIGKDQICYDKMISSPQSDDLVDCCVSMLEWLHNNKEELGLMNPEEMELYRKEHFQEDESNDND